MAVDGEKLLLLAKQYFPKLKGLVALKYAGWMSRRLEDLSYEELNQFLKDTGSAIVLTPESYAQARELAQADDIDKIADALGHEKFVTSLVSKVMPKEKEFKIEFVSQCKHCRGFQISEVTLSQSDPEVE